MRTLPLKFYLQKPLYCDRFLNKALLAPDGSKEDGKVCSVSDVEEAKSVLRLFPIWASCLAFAIVFAQPPTFFTKQGVTMDRSIGSGFKVPAAYFNASSASPSFSSSPYMTAFWFLPQEF